MMKIMKKIIPIIIIILILQINLMPIISLSHATTEEIFTGVDISKNGDGSVIAKLSADQTTLYISGVGKMKNFLTYNTPWEDYKEKLKKGIIDQGIINIGKWAFCGCGSLETIKIPNSVTSIEDGAFQECSSLINIEIPDSVTSIGAQIFDECTSLREIKIPSSVTSIGAWAFYECSSLIKIDIPNSVTSIGTSAFEGCSSLINIEIPDNVTSIGTSTFEGCSSLNNIEIPNAVTMIGYAAFQKCSSLREIKIPSSVTSIGKYAFQDCGSLINIEIPSSVTSIGNNAFLGCNLLIRVNENEADIVIPEVLNRTMNQSDVLYSAQEHTLYNCEFIQNKEKIKLIKNMEVGSIKINDGALENFVVNIIPQEIHISKDEDGSVIATPSEELDTLTISGTGKMQDYHYNENIPWYSFRGMIKNVIINQGVTNIGKQALSGCSSIINIEIPNSVTSIGDWAFSCCSSLHNINVAAGNNAYTSDGGILFNKNKTKLIKYPPGKEESRYAIPSYVNEIAIGAFYDISNYFSVIIPEEVLEIDEYAFDKWNDNIEIICKNGSSAETYAKEKNIAYIADNTIQGLKINYSTKTSTIKSITVTISAEEELRKIGDDWEISEDRKQLRKSYKENTKEKITIKDLVGNASEKIIEINNIVDLLIDGQTVKDGYVMGIQPNTTCQVLKQHIESKKEYAIKEGDNVVTDTSKIKTGQTLVVGEKSYTLVVKGDTNGDGEADLKDMYQINLHRLGKGQKPLDEMQQLAANVYEDNSIDLKDMYKINLYRLKKSSSI